MNPKDHEKLIEHILQSLFFNFYIIDAQTYQILRINDAAKQGREIGGMTCHLLTHRNPVPCDSEEHGCPLQEVKKTGAPATMVHTHFDNDGNPRLYEVHGYPIKDERGNVVQMIEYSIDITDRVRAEEESKKAIAALEEANSVKEQLIASKEETLHEMATPVVEIWEGLLVAPIIGFIDSRRGAEITEKLLNNVTSTHAKAVIIDITGIDVLDSGTADQVIRMSKAIRLLGAEPVITGVSPAIAETMTQIDVDLGLVVTLRSLKEGLRWYLSKSTAKRTPNRARHERNSLLASGIKSDKER